MKRIILPVFLAALLLSVSATSAQTLFWTLNTKDAVLKGDSKGVAIDDTGSIYPAPAVSSGYATNEQFIWSSASDSSGNVYLGTGGNGKVFKVDAAGKGALFFDSEELNVSALAAGRDGSLFAATSPDGKVYRIDSSGKSSVYFEPKTKYIWSLAAAQDGGLFVGTGETGKIFRVTGAGASPDASVFYDSRETHIICMTTDKNGNLFAGTDESGLVLRIGTDKKAFAILDSTLREIHEVSVGPDGSVYVLALSESVSAKTPEASKTETAKDDTVSVDIPDPSSPPAAPTPEKSRYDVSSSKSIVYRVLPDGTGDIIWNSDTIPAFSITADPAGGGVFVGTSDKGRIFRISDTAGESLLVQTEEEQISTLLAVGGRIIATTSNQGRSFSFGTGNIGEGVYESPVLDAKSSAKWGRIWSQKTGNVELETRSGNSARPGETWSGWTSATNSDGRITSPPGRFFQWRAKLGSVNAGSIRETTVSFSTLNIAPEVLSIEVLPPNVGLAPNPEVPIDPNIEALGLNPGDFGLAVAAVPPRRVFQSGARAIQWKGSDRNGDQLKYSVYLSKVGENKFRHIGTSGADDFVTLDGLSMEDGRYVIKIVADDSPSNGVSNSKSGERISEPFEIDNSPPTVAVTGSPVLNGNTLTILFSANESSSFITRAEYSLNGGSWKPVYPDDGIADGKSESFNLKLDLVDTGTYVVAIRVFDAVGNIGSTRLVK